MCRAKGSDQTFQPVCSMMQCATALVGLRLEEAADAVANAKSRKNIYAYMMSPATQSAIAKERARFNEHAARVTAAYERYKAAREEAKSRSSASVLTPIPEYTAHNIRMVVMERRLATSNAEQIAALDAIQTEIGMVEARVADYNRLISKQSETDISNGVLDELEAQVHRAAEPIDEYALLTKYNGELYLGIEFDEERYWQKLVRDE